MWSLPFAERYHRIHRTFREAPTEIERLQKAIAARQKEMAWWAEAQAAAKREWELMQIHDADQIESLEAHHRDVTQALRAAGWKI